jgi:uncharacterized membrane protein
MALIATLVGFFFLQLMILSLVGLLVTGVLLSNYDFRVKMEILFCLFAVLFSLPFLVLIIILSERLWFRASGAEKLVQSVTTGRDSCKSA